MWPGVTKKVPETREVNGFTFYHFFWIGDLLWHAPSHQQAQDPWLGKLPGTGGGKKEEFFLFLNVFLDVSLHGFWCYSNVCCF